MISTNYLSVADFENMNPEIDFTNYADATISGMITRASAQMDNILNYTLSVEDIIGETNEPTISNQGNLTIFTRKFPVISVAAVSLKLGTVNLALNLTDAAGNPRYDIPSRARSFTYPYQEIAMTGTFSVRNFYQLRGVEIFAKYSYRAGYDTIPSDLKDACNLITKDIFIRQSNPMDLSSVNQGAVAMGFKNRGNFGNEDSKWMKDAKQILQSYRRLTA